MHVMHGWCAPAGGRVDLAPAFICFIILTARSRVPSATQMQPTVEWCHTHHCQLMVLWNLCSLYVAGL